MKKFKFILFALTFLPIISRAQLLNNPKTTAKKFAKAISKGDFEKAISFCIMDAKKDTERMAKRSEVITINTISCELIETNIGVNCECLSEASGRTRNMVYSMTEIDGHWKIYEVDSKPVKNSNNSANNDKQYAAKNKTPKSVSLPKTEIEKFVQFNAAKKYKKAGTILIMNAKIAFDQNVLNNPNDLPVLVNTINCNETKPGMMDCSCMQTNVSGKEEGAVYKLTQVDNKWKIYEIHIGHAGEFVTRIFVNALADGDCGLAKDLTIGAATDLVQGSIDVGCEPYKTEVLSVKCIYNDNQASCDCKEKRDGLEMTFKYDLEKKNNQWYIANYQKDFKMDGEEINYNGDSGTKKIKIGDDEIVELDLNSFDEEPLMERVSIEQNPIADFAEIQPEFPGGDQALGEFLKNNIIYPHLAIEMNVKGTVYVQFVVDAIGAISNVVVIKGVTAELDAEAIRVVKLMPNWKPGEQAGKHIAVRYTLPIRFTTN